MSQHAIRVIEEGELGRKVKRYVFRRMQAMRSALLEKNALGALLFYETPCRVLTPTNQPSIESIQNQEAT